MFMDDIVMAENCPGNAAVLAIEGVYVVLICTLFAIADACAVPTVPMPHAPAMTTMVPLGVIL
jgi:uncharacterized membrane protein YedE/YeeE